MENPDQVANSLLTLAKETVGKDAPPHKIWAVLQQHLKPSMPIDVHVSCYKKVYEGIEDVKPMWIPSEGVVKDSNIDKMMKEKGFSTYNEFFDWSVGESTRDEFWMESTKKVSIVFEKEPTSAFKVDERGSAHATYFPNATLNISDSCFNRPGRNPEDPALVYAVQSQPRDLQTMSYSVLDRLSCQIANALQTKVSLAPGDAVGICMPMTPETIAIYLGIVKAGCVVVSIADSFAAEEIETRCRLAGAKAIFTQDVIYRGAKALPLFEKVLEANRRLRWNNAKVDTNGFDETKETKSDNGDGAMSIVVLPAMLHSGSYPKLAKMHRSASGTWDDRDEAGNPVGVHDRVLELMREGLDFTWHSFMHECSDKFVSVKLDSMDPCNILFSSGTTGEPKAIVWSHSTPVKCAVDGYYHQDIHTGDGVAWPTNIGWMMGPWLVFQLINGATIGIFNGTTSDDAFCQFVDEAKISMLGVIPSIVKAWQAKDATKDCDWSCVKKFSSTGEASDPWNYLWLASRVPGFAPVMEYCGGTEIGGSYLSSTVVQPNVPSMFSTPVLGSHIFLLDKEGTAQIQNSKDRFSGEVALCPPALGLSTQLLNRNHFDTYYADMNPGPNGEVLRKHGDEILFVSSSELTEKMSEETSQYASRGYYRALGRCDDTMNIGGIKVGSIDIERACNLVDVVRETAAIGVSPPAGGPLKLVIYAILNSIDVDEVALKAAMKESIKIHLNPLFVISDVVITNELPRTASNKVMRRKLRDEYIKNKF